MAASKEAHEEEKHGVEKHFAQHLAANEVRTRDRAVKKVSKWMKARSAKDSGFAKGELLKLWKGLYYCMWMSDKMLIQEDLADSLAEMVHNMVTPKQGLLFYQTFLITIGREWHGIDYLRVDKFYMLFRRVLRQTLMVLQKNAWEPSLVKSFLKILSRLIFRPNWDLYPSGLRLFMVDIYIEELSRVSDDELTEEHVLWFLEPLARLAAETKEFTLTDSIMTVVFEEIVNQSWLGQEGEKEDREFEFLEEANKKVKVEGVKAFEELPMLEFDHEGISAMLLKFASKPGTLSRNRKRIYKTTVLYHNLLQGIHPSQLLKPLKKDRVDRFMKIDNPQRADMMIRAKKKSKDRLKLFLQRRKERKLQRQGAMRGQRTDEGGVEESGKEGIVSSPTTAEEDPNAALQDHGLEGSRDEEVPVDGVSGSGTETGKGLSSKRKKRKAARAGKVDDSLSEAQKSQERMGDAKLLRGQTKGDSLATVLFKDADDVEDVAMTDGGEKGDRSTGPVSPKKSKKASKKTKSMTEGREEAQESVKEDATSMMDEGGQEMENERKTPRRGRGKSEVGAKQQEDGLMNEQAVENSIKTNDSREEEGGQMEMVVDLDKVADIPKKKTPKKSKSPRKFIVSEDAGTVDPAGESIDSEGLRAGDKVVAVDSGEKGGIEKVTASSGKKTPRKRRNKRKSSSVSDEGVAGSSPGTTAVGGEVDASIGVVQGEMLLQGTDEGKTPKQDKKKRKSSAGTNKKLEGAQEGSKKFYSPPVTRKRVTIALAHNEQLPSADYKRRIKASPGIPFDKEKKPQSPAIKPAPPTSVRRSARKKRISMKLT